MKKICKCYASVIEIVLVCSFIVFVGLVSNDLKNTFTAKESEETQEIVEQTSSVDKYDQDVVQSKMSEIYASEKDDILNTIIVQDEEIDKVMTNYPSLDEVRILTLEDNNVFYVLKEDTKEYKVGTEVNNSKVKDIRYATKDEVRNIIKSELIIEKANEELYRRALTSLENENKK